MAILLIGIGYASLANNTLSISGNASAIADQDNFKVYFTGNVPKKYTSDTKIIVDAKPVAQYQNATVNILGLNKKDDTGYAILEIENGSNGIDAEITVTTEATSTEMFDIDVIMCDKEGNAISDFLVASGEKTYAKIFVKLLKTPINIQKATISAKITAMVKEVDREDPPIIPDVPSKIDIFSAYYDKAEEKLNTLTIDDKIGQLFIAGSHDATCFDKLEQYQFGGYLFFASFFENKDADTIKSQIQQFQSKVKIPLLTAVDEEGGVVVRVSSNPNLAPEPFKSPSELYAINGFETIREDTINKSNLLGNLGLNLNFAPVVDIADPGSYMYNRGRTLKEGAELTSTYAKTVIETSKSLGVSYTLKHFPGYGSSGDTHLGFETDIRSREEFENKDLKPFKAGIESGAEIVMVSHNIVTCFDPNFPASISKNVHNLLRDELEYSGIIITDGINMGAIDKQYSMEEAIIMAINSGNDMICLDMTDGVTVNEKTGEILTFSGIKKYVKDAVDRGDITEETINIAVKRILAWKYYKGLMK